MFNNSNFEEGSMGLFSDSVYYEYLGRKIEVEARSTFDGIKGGL